MRRDPFTDLEALVERVYAYLAYRLGDEAEAERVAAKVFDLALRHRAAVGREDPALFLVALARQQLAAAEHGDPAALPQGTRHFGLEPALAELDERDRDLIGLRYGADLTHDQIGELLEAPSAQAASLVRAAVERLRERTFVVV